MKTIVIDPGHGGSDRSNRGYSGQYVEADGNLTFALFLKYFLQEHFNVVLTREKDISVSLSERGKIANRNKADMFISIHSDAYSATSSGVTIFDSVDLSNEEIAAKIGQACANAMGIPFKGPRENESTNYPGEDYYTVIDVAQDGCVPVVLLLERGFHSNPVEEKILLNDNITRTAAIAVAEEIKKYYGVEAVKVEEIKTIDEALEKLDQEVGIDVGYWKGACDYVGYLRELFIKIARRFEEGEIK